MTLAARDRAAGRRKAPEAGEETFLRSGVPRDPLYGAPTISLENCL